VSNYCLAIKLLGVKPEDTDWKAYEEHIKYHTKYGPRNLVTGEVYP